MADFEDLTAQSMPGALLSSQMESARALNETPTDEAVAESSLLWFLRWFNENSTLGHASQSITEDVEDSSPSASTSNQALDPPSLVPCRICIDDIPDNEAIPIPYCNHTFCKDCLSTYVTGKLKEGRYPIHCPCCTMEDRTDVHVTEGVLEELDLSEEILERLVEAQLSTHAISLSCIRCKQTMRVDREGYQTLNIIMCPLPGCNHRWCKSCRKEVGSCDTGHRCRNWRLDGLAWTKGWRSCPGCGVVVERVSGCNHMICVAPGCFVHFCYRCGKLIIDPSKGGHVGSALTSHYSRCRQHDRRFLPHRIQRNCTIQ